MPEESNDEQQPPRISYVHPRRHPPARPPAEPPPSEPPLEPSAIDLYRPSAEAGDPDAMLIMGIAHEERGASQEALHWHRRAAEAGRPYGLTRIGQILEQEGRTEEAESHYRRAKALGDQAGELRLDSLLSRRRLSPLSGRPAPRPLAGSGRPDSDRAKTWSALGFIVLVIGVIVSFAVRVGPETPDCDGQSMGPGDKCVAISGGGDSFTYEEFMDERAEKERRWADGPPPEALLGYALIGAGVLMFGVSGVQRLRGDG